MHLDISELPIVSCLILISRFTEALFRGDANSLIRRFISFLSVFPMTWVTSLQRIKWTGAYNLSAMFEDIPAYSVC